VLIVGAGLGGLALANVLKHQGVPFKIFERDSSPEDRTQGWSLSMHFCLFLLKSLMDPVKYATLGKKSAVDPANPSDNDFSLIDGNKGERIVKFGGIPGADVFRVNRKRFRAWLMEGIDVQWNKRIDHYTVDKDEDGVQVTFTDGTVEEGSILVGADGVNSQVCRQLIGTEAFDKTTTENPLNLLVSSYWINSEFRRNIVDTLAPAHMMAAASGSEEDEHSLGLFSSLVDVDLNQEKPFEMLWCLSNINEKEPRYDTDQERLKQAKEWATNAGFSGLLSRLIMETPEDTQVVRIQIRERSPHEKLDTLRDPVVLLGDALHTMTMYRGEGGNHAIQDSCLLGLELISMYKGEKTLQEALDAYYKESLPRGRKAVAESHEALNQMHSSKAQVLGMM
ncbi:hypothetical protein BDA99DRAFT_420775, partial [Phascolomyces articulosus]